MYSYTERIVGPQDIYEILDNPIHIKFFKSFLNTVQANENISCWQAINDLKTTEYPYFSF